MYFEWDERGIHFSALHTLPPRTETVSLEGQTIYRVPWDELRALEPTDPWPRLRIAWGDDEEILIPPLEEEAEFARWVEDAAAAARERTPEAVRLGWLAAEDIAWEVVKYLPGERPPPRSLGAYRSAEDHEEDPVVAHRELLSPIEAFFDWLVQIPALPFRERPVAITLTDAHIYVRRRDGVAERLPRSQLRTSVTVPRGGVVYVFGRRMRLLIASGPRGQSIREVLDAQLRAARAA